jgi:hypothetical protein
LHMVLLIDLVGATVKYNAATSSKKQQTSTQKAKPNEYQL